MDRDVKVRLSETNMKKYIEFEKEQILRLPEEETGDVSALNAAALSNKLLQFANGAVYDPNAACMRYMPRSWRRLRR